MKNFHTKWFDVSLIVVIAVGGGVVLLLVLLLCCCAYWCCCRRRKDLDGLPKSKDTKYASPSPSARKGGEYVEYPYPSPPGGLPGTVSGSGSGTSFGNGSSGSSSVPASMHSRQPSDGLRPPSQSPQKPSPLRPLSAGQDVSDLSVAKWEDDLRAAMFRKMRLAEIRVATNEFDRSNYLGEGAFAVVYRGIGLGGVPWAVKRTKKELSRGSAGALDFENEVLMISRLAHKNLVRLLGYCIEEGEHMLVYELVENGSLAAALQKSSPQLSFVQRLNVAVGVAEAIHYLHNAAAPPILHRDIKPDNILLDANLNAKVADFGLLKNLREGQESSVYTRVAGTPGYLDPDYHLTSRITTKGDVYSYGVVLLELFTGRRAIIMPPPPGQGEEGVMAHDQTPMHISSFVGPYVKERLVQPLADERFGNDYSQNVLLKVLEIAMSCVRSPSRLRPDMGNVLRGLTDAREELARERGERPAYETEVMERDPFSHVLNVDSMIEDTSGVGKAVPVGSSSVAKESTSR